MRSLEELNLSNVRRALSEREIREAEEYLGFRMPTSYRNFLLAANGGHPEVDTFETADEQWAVNNFFYLGDEDDSTNSLMWNYRNRWNELPASFLPIARDGFGNRFLLKSTKDDEDEVWVWVHDDPDQPHIKLCDNFDDFISGLKLNPDYI